MGTEACQDLAISLGSPGPFYTFDLARQLERLGYLGKMYTAYPRWKVDGLPQQKVATFPWFMGLAWLARRWGADRFSEWLNGAVIETFDRWMASVLGRCEVFHCLSSFGLAAHRTAKQRYGALTVCDRGSSHILYQDEILTEEYARWGIPYNHINARIMERELQEYEECDLIFVPSAFAYRSFVEKGLSPQKVVKIPFGVDSTLFHPMPKRDDVFRVIYVGALSLRKGIPYLLEALASVKLPKFEVWLIGGCLREARPFLKQYEGGYRYCGIVPRPELYTYYSQGSVFVMASVEEGLALVQAQALACGLPVIATTNTGAEDLFTDGLEGFIVPIRNSEAIREKVMYLYEHPDVREELAAAALKRVHNLGGWDTYGEQVVAAYKRALARVG